MANKYQAYYNQTVGLCKKCDPKGFVKHGKNYTPCSCHIEYTRLKILHDSGLPKAYWNETPDTFSGDQKALAEVLRYIENIDDNLNKGIGQYLYGNAGVGKTLLASYILKAGLEKRKNIKFYFFTDVLNVFTESWHDDAARAEVENSIIKSDLLILDDIGKEYKSNTKLHESILDTVIRNRASYLRPVIITSNYDMLDSKEAYGNGIVDLFKESLQVIHVTGNSYRATKLTEKKKDQ